MKTILRPPVFYVILLLAAGSSVAGFAAGTAPAAGTSGGVKVEFREPEKFRDVRLNGLSEKASCEIIQAEFEKHLASLAQHYLPADQTLTVTITDLDLAGEFEPQHGPRFNDVRIVRDAYPPRINLEYVLTGPDGTVVASGKANLTDLAFQFNADLRDREQLHYENTLLTDWFKKTFAAKH